ncbi:hypothetical protein IEQ34_018553 [Dendrobium chrysotoxum]|uniref:Secreted protein n=1 Tax=Dendrobium chrysotoxum TaxID=161865 RepID=A0AAV7G5J2_DENCH|nr:hypothetical protein IEQ34_018553 [Dendrobium chrysotoxum]
MEISWAVGVSFQLTVAVVGKTAGVKSARSSSKGMCSRIRNGSMRRSVTGSSDWSREAEDGVVVESRKRRRLKEKKAVRVIMAEFSSRFL